MSMQFEKDWRLFLAARDGDLEAGREALVAGADPNFVEPPNRKRPSSKPRSVLLRAVERGDTAFAEMLLNAGASIPMSKDEQERLSYGARCSGNPATLLLLLHQGLTPVRDDADWAQARGYREVHEFIEQALGKLVIKYDIDELLTKPYNKFYYEFCQAVPPYYSIQDPLLFQRNA